MMEIDTTSLRFYALSLALVPGDGGLVLMGSWKRGMIEIVGPFLLCAALTSSFVLALHVGLVPRWLWFLGVLPLSVFPVAVLIYVSAYRKPPMHVLTIQATGNAVR